MYSSPFKNHKIQIKASLFFFFPLPDEKLLFAQKHDKN